MQAYQPLPPDEERAFRQALSEAMASHPDDRTTFVMAGLAGTIDALRVRVTELEAQIATTAKASEP